MRKFYLADAMSSFWFFVVSFVGQAVASSYDLVVYGTTAAGVIAAVEGARSGLKVVLVGPDKHVGGMTSHGLGWTDVGNAESIGGLAREFYEQVGVKYGKPSTAVFAFEPHVALEVLSEMLNATSVALYLNERLDAVAKSGSNIVSITSSKHIVFHARYFIDASYEGDLMAAAGVSHTVGREAISKYNEPYAGIRIKDAENSPAAADEIDPYEKLGVPSSGFQSAITSRTLASKSEQGKTDLSVMAYNYRLCVTDKPANSVPFPLPANYDSNDYNLLKRWFAKHPSATLTQVIKLSALPNRKFDLNNGGDMSTDFVNGSYSYPEGNSIIRNNVAYKTKEWMLGLFRLLATDAHVPARIKSEMARYGLCADEFIDSGHWPAQLYVRGARRMVGEKIMTQAEVESQAPVSDSVALGSYRLDGHAMQRRAVVSPITGKPIAVTEGSVFSNNDYPTPYKISMRSLLPKASEADNLVVPVCLSASHVAFTSLRMEPVYMMLGQAAASIAAEAKKYDTRVQNVSYGEVQKRLLAEGQRLVW